MNRQLIMFCILVLEMSQTHFTLDLTTHFKNAMNAVKFAMPVDCKYYDSVSIGDNLLKKNFRWGSFFMKGSIGNWNLKVKEKHEQK